MPYKRGRSVIRSRSSKRRRTTRRTGRRSLPRRYNYKKYSSRWSRISRGINNKRAPKNGVLKSGPVVRVTYKYTGSQTLPSGPLTTSMIALGATIRANSIYDPNVAITGAFNTATSWYNFYSKFYNRYEVLGTKIVLTVRQLSNSNPADGYAGIYPSYKVGLKLDDDGTAFTTTENWVNLTSDPNVNMRTLKMTDSADGQVSVPIVYKPSKWFSKDERVDNMAYFGANPANEVRSVGFIQMENLDSGEINSAYGYGVTFTYDVTYVVRLSDMKDIRELPAEMKIEQM